MWQTVCKPDKQMAVSFLSGRDCKSLVEDYHNGPFLFLAQFPSRVITNCSYLSLSLSVAKLMGGISWEICEYKPKRETSQRHTAMNENLEDAN